MIRTNERTKIAITPTIVIKGDKNAKNAGNVTSSNAKPAIMPAKNKKINRSMCFPPL